MPTILLIGATGTVGRQLVSDLLPTNTKIRALLRNPDSANLPPAIEKFRGDLTVPDSLVPALKNTDAVFLVWTAPPATAPAVIDRIAQNTQRLVFLTAPHQTPHPFFQQPNALSAMLSSIERHIESTPLQSTFLRPGMFAANCIDWWAPTFRNNDVIRWPLLQAPTAPIDTRDIAAVAARILTDPQHKRTRNPTSPKTTSSPAPNPSPNSSNSKSSPTQFTAPSATKTSPPAKPAASSPQHFLPPRSTCSSTPGPPPWANPPTSPLPSPTSSTAPPTPSAPGPNTTPPPSSQHPPAKSPLTQKRKSPTAKR